MEQTRKREEGNRSVGGEKRRRGIVKKSFSNHFIDTSVYRDRSDVTSQTKKEDALEIV